MAIIIQPKIQMPGVMSKLQKLEDKLVGIKKRVDELNESLKYTVQLANAAGAGLGRMRGPSNAGSSRAGYSKMYGSPIGPAQYVPQYNSFVGPITPAQHAKMMGGLAKPPKQKMPMTFGKAVMNAILRSRISASGGMMPLVMDIVKVLGTLGPEMALAATAILFGSKLLSVAINEADKFLTDARLAMVQGGGSMTTATASVLAQRTLGINPGDIGRNLMHGYGPIAAGGAGVNPYGGPFGDNKYNEKGLKVLDWIRRSSNFDQARRRAEMAGSPDAASAYQLSNTTYGMIRHPANAVPAQNVGISAEFNANMSIFTTNMQQLAAVFAGPAMSMINDGLKVINLSFMMMAPVLSAIGTGLIAIAQSSGIHLLLELIEAIAGTNNKKDDAINKNTDAVNDLNKTYKEGIYGGGPNAQNAMPSRWNPNNPHGGTNPAYGIPV